MMKPQSRPRAFRLPNIGLAAALLTTAAVATADTKSRPHSEPSREALASLPTPEERERVRKGLTIATPGAAPSSLDAAAQSAQDNVDITSYLLDLEFVPVTQSVTGSVSISGKSLVPGLTHLVLDLLDNMTVTSVTRAGTRLPFTHAGNLLDITFDRAYSAGQSFFVKVAYAGVPQRIGLGSIGWNKYVGGPQGKMVWTLSEPSSARSWWPCKDRPDDKAAVETRWTVPESWFATGNGILLGTTKVPPGKKQYRWRSSHPLTTYLVMIAATDYVHFGDTYTSLAGDSMPVDYYVYAEHLGEAQQSFSNTVAMISFYAQTFGEYPFADEKYGMSSLPWGGAMEHTTNTSYGYLSIDGGHGKDWLIAHELAHQWWGDSVSPESWADVWLNEGVATYSEALWTEHLLGPSGYRDYMISLWREKFSGSVYDPTTLFNATVYDKGAWVLHMLRKVLGTAAFSDGLRDWYSARFDSTGNTAQFQQTMEARYGAPLDWFFDAWVYGENSPRYEYGWTTADPGSGVFRTYVRVHQVQTDADTFVMPLDMTLVSDVGSAVVTVWNNSSDQDFVFETTTPIRDVLLDDEDWVLKASKTVIILADGDGDGVPDHNDNCPDEVNPSQSDIDGDGAGDVCDADGLAAAAD